MKTKRYYFILEIRLLFWEICQVYIFCKIFNFRANQTDKQRQKNIDQTIQNEKKRKAEETIDEIQSRLNKKAKNYYEMIGTELYFLSL